MAKASNALTPDEASGVSIAALGWLAGEPELLGRFLALSGLSVTTLRRAAEDRGFLAGVLAFLLNHEPTLVQFCKATATTPETVDAAYRVLSPEAPGGAES